MERKCCGPVLYPLFRGLAFLFQEAHDLVYISSHFVARETSRTKYFPLITLQKGACIVIEFQLTQDVEVQV